MTPAFVWVLGTLTTPTHQCVQTVNDPGRENPATRSGDRPVALKRRHWLSMATFRLGRCRLPAAVGAD